MVSPLPIYLPETLQFRAAPKNAVHFLYEAVLHRPVLLRLVTPVLPKALCKSSRIRLTPNSGMVCRFPPWYAFSPVEPAICIRIQRKLNSGLWLTAFDKSGLFRCQSAPGPPMPCFLIWNRQSVSEFSSAEFGALARGFW